MTFGFRASCLVTVSLIALADHAAGQDVSRGPFGGPGGAAFGHTAPAGHYLSRVVVRWDDVVGNIRFEYRDLDNKSTGGSGWLGVGGGKRESSFILARYEHLARVVVRYRPEGVVERLELVTNFGRNEIYGHRTGTRTAVMHVQSHEVVGFHGRAGSVIDALGVTLRPRTRPGWFKAYGRSCSRNLPTITHGGGDPPLVGTRYRWTVSGVPSLPGVVLLGAWPTDVDLWPIAMPGCSLLTSPFTTLPFETDDAGWARIWIDLRNASRSLVGRSVFTQAIVWNGQTSIPRLGFSRGIETVVGS